MMACRTNRHVHDDPSPDASSKRSLTSSILFTFIFSCSFFSSAHVSGRCRGPRDPRCCCATSCPAHSTRDVSSLSVTRASNTTTRRTLIPSIARR
ncbi:hypothetical protein E2C01_040504 [Portunus trituberculatus]|uniref:Uncharacterized protein n=1 Tax=Portunus trituberculatus TaxID=210409 RepID=A0A5B7FPE0_PORTR|nr:hypothetical protein [Portunus trituberculatus]